jgi:4-carboxymuconolactone decarboxylase
MPQRIAPLEPPYAPDVDDTLKAMMPPGVPPLRLFRTLAHNPRVLDKIRNGNLLDRGSIERRTRELVILRTCARCGSEYEWGVHVAIFAARFGLSEETVAGTREWHRDDPRWSEEERLLVELVDSLHEQARVSDALWARLAKRFDADAIVELVVLTGFYHTISFVTNALEIELEEAGAHFPAGATA